MKIRRRVTTLYTSYILLITCLLFLLVRLRSSRKKSSERTPPLPVFNDFVDLNTSVTELQNSGFLVPQFVGSSRTGKLVWKELSGVCVNGKDHVRYLNLSSSFEQSSKAAGLFRSTQPYRLEPISATELESNGVFKLRGKSLLLQCWEAKPSQLTSCLDMESFLVE